MYDVYIVNLKDISYNEAIEDKDNPKNSIDSKKINKIGKSVYMRSL